MRVTHVSLTNYRAFTRLDMDVPRRIILLVGGNAQGKTSLLESIYYLATFTSVQAQQDRQLINFLALREKLPVCRIVADFERGGKTHRTEIRLILEANRNGKTRFRKEILIDGVRRSVQQALGLFTSVIFLPQMTRIIEDGPDERRRFLNLLISQAMPEYAVDLSEYNQVLAQRNALLKQIAERQTDQSQLKFWDDLLTRRGASLIYKRIHVLYEIERFAARIHHHLTRSKEVLRIEYVPSYDPLRKPENQYALPIDDPVSRLDFSLEQVQKGFLKGLDKIRFEEVARGVTTIGPHRDEIRFLANGIDLGIYGSRGQVRTALLALKLAEVKWLHDKTGHWPVVLLDEIMAELDKSRRADLMSYLTDLEQVILSTTDLDLFAPDFVEEHSIWLVENGLVSLAK